MNDKTRRDLAVLLVGMVLVALGLVMLLGFPDTTVSAIGGLALFPGGVVFSVGLWEVVRDLNTPSDPPR